jgi:hypothetical protein
MAERQPSHPPIPGPQRPPHEGGNGSRGIPATIHEQAQPPPEQTQPLQGRAAGRESLQGPTTVDRSEHADERRRNTSVQFQFSSEAWKYYDLTSFFARRRNTSVQQSQPEDEPASMQPKRKRGRPKLSEFSEEERLRRKYERYTRVRLQELRKEMKQIRETLSEEEQRDVRRLRKYAREGVKGDINRESEGTVEITIWPYQKDRE